MRALGCGQTVCLVQFLKGRGTGEVDFLEKTPGITILRGKTAACFTFQMNEAQKAECAVRQAEIFAEGMAMARQGRCDLLILDECLGAIGSGTLDESVVLDFLRHKPAHLEVVLTGRDPSDTLIELADYVSEIRKIKHPFDKGLAARMGIEK